MISVILYGRNDAHGYNLHKRAAISLNCIAEMLSDGEDEILFVDYNTAGELPTFIEAIYDTLTPRAKAMLRVFRVRPKLHSRLVANAQMPVVEPHARNIALRRSNPRNRWILSTNTDMIFVPRQGTNDLTGTARDLPDALYTLPRFELPEPLWESFPRMDPQSVIVRCAELGRRLHLEEIAVSHPFIRFDAPGDFQLVPRKALFDIFGFDERMTHGWLHADSNVCKRLNIYFGNRTENLADRLKGFHCDHTRVARLEERLDSKLQNDLQEFVFAVTDPVARHQAESWGAPGETIEEVDFKDGPAARFSVALERTLGASQKDDYHSDANDLRNFVWYRPEHALPYVAASLTVYPREARFAYVGNNPRMLELTASAVRQLGFEAPLRYVRHFFTTQPQVEDATAVDGDPGRLLSDFALLIFDFGLDCQGVDFQKVERVTDWPRSLRYSLGAVARLLSDCAFEGDTAANRGHLPDIVVVNASHHIFSALAGQFLITAGAPFSTHVRKGRLRVGEERVGPSSAWKNTEDQMRSFFGYDVRVHESVTVDLGDVIDLTSAGRSAGFKDGHWGLMDASGSWTDGHRAAILFTPPSPTAGDLIVFAHVNEAFIGLENEPMYVQVLLDGEQLARWTFFTRYEVTVATVRLPARLLAGRSMCRLELFVEKPQSAERVARALGEMVIGEDPRELGVKIQKIEFAGIERIRHPLDQVLDFTESGSGRDYADECWTRPDRSGTWTLGTAPSIWISPREATDQAVVAHFSINDVALSDQQPGLDVSVSVKGRELARWKLGPGRRAEERSVTLPAGTFASQEPVNIVFGIRDPRTPAQLGWNATDVRPLGFRLARVVFDSTRGTMWRSLRGLVRRLLR